MIREHHYIRLFMTKSQRVEVDPKAPILVVSAQFESAKFLENSLRTNGLTNIQSTESGIEAFDRLKKQEIKLLIVDLEVRYIDGWRFVKKSKTRKSSLMFLVCWSDPKTAKLPKMS
jgi:CheY-like chemotaxis protein